MLRDAVRLPLFTLIGLFGALAGGGGLAAQCSTSFAPGHAVPGADGPVQASTMWDPDGSGPAPARLVIGGGFRAVTNVVARGLAAWDPATDTWAPFGAGVDGTVHCVATLANGDIVAGGWFTTSGGLPVNHVARWDGAAWRALGTGVTAGSWGTSVSALAVLPNGDIVAGGSFSNASGTAVGNLARWDGTSWTSMGAANGPVLGLAVRPSGAVVATGAFTSIGGIPANYIAEWNGVAWSSLGSGLGNSGYTVGLLPNGDVAVGGQFTTAGGAPANFIARWDGGAWWPMGTGASYLVRALLPLPNGQLIAGGSFQFAGGVDVRCVARWDGAQWSAYGGGLDLAVSALTLLPNGDLVAGGPYVGAGPQKASAIARWDGQTWSAFATGWDGTVRALTIDANGDVLIGGAFVGIEAGPVSAICRLDATGIHPLGSGMPNPVLALAAFPDGRIVAGGAFGMAGGGNAKRVALWDGSAWSALGPGLGATGPMEEVNALAVLANGDIVAGGSFQGLPAYLAQWDGTTWQAVGGGVNGSVRALATTDDGDLLVGGAFSHVNGTPMPCVARWDGTAWSSLGSGMGPVTYSLGRRVECLLSMPNGDVVAGGAFATAGGVAANSIARWNGSTWVPLGLGIDGLVQTLSLLPDGGIFAGGQFTSAGGNPATNCARWDGTQWWPVDGGANAIVYASTWSPAGRLFLGGHFTVVGSRVSSRLAQLASSCAAAAVSYGSGCIGASGPVALEAIELPWEGGVFHSRATGLPPHAIVLSALGFTQLAVPLAQLLPQGIAGCDLLASPDRIDLALAQGGAADLLVPVIVTPSLLGVPVYHQVVVAEHDAAWNLTGLSSANGLVLSVGVF